jgi:putative ABC transport system ATP-binding protein
MDDVARARLRARRVGVVLQSGNLIPFLTALQNVELALGFGDGEGDGERARDLLSSLGLGDRLHHLPRRMSGGEAQRVSVAVALANQPDLLLADEVTGQLDSANAEQVMEVIFDAWRRLGLTVLFVTHNRELAARAQRCLVLERGEVRDL